MKIAICMSGLARTFSCCYQSLYDNILKHYDCDVFLYASKDQESPAFSKMKCTKSVLLEEPVKLDEKDYKNYNCRNYSTQGLLQQFWKIEECHKLMTQYSQENNIKYDFVIRCRPDLQYVRVIDDLNKLNKNYLYVHTEFRWQCENPQIPVKRKFKWTRECDIYAENYEYTYPEQIGLPDQFAIATPAIMEIYASRHSNWDKYYASGIPLHAEISLTKVLKNNDIKVKFIKPLYNIIRKC